MKFKFSNAMERESFINRLGNEKILIDFENCFSKEIEFSKNKQRILKRFFVAEPEGRDILIKNLQQYPYLKLYIRSFELMPLSEILGVILFSSEHYVLKEDASKGLILIEQHTCKMPLSQFEY